MRFKLYSIVVLLFAAAIAAGQNASKNVVGTVNTVRVEASEIEAKTDAGVVTIKLAPETVVKSVAPGETSLAKAVDANIEAIHPGDRVLVTIQGDLVRRVIVMQAKSIEQWKEADKAEWQKRGVAGVVKEKKATELVLKGAGENTYVVTLKPNATFKRYPAESVKFADAKISKLEEVQVGDQLRARGEKAADGKSVTADEVVFGTFVTRAGIIQSIDANGAIIAKDISGKEILTVHLTADSQIKKFGAGGGPGGGGMRPPSADGAGPRAGGPPAGEGPRQGGGPEGPRPGGPGGQGAGPGGPGGGRRFDVSQIVERLPVGTKDDLKVGETIVFSSSVALAAQGSKNDLTAIMLVANAERLLALAAPPRPAQQRDMAFGAGGGGGGGMGLGGLELPIFQ